MLLLLLKSHASDTTPRWARVSLSAALRAGVSLSVTLLGRVSLEEDP